MTAHHSHLTTGSPNAHHVECRVASAAVSVALTVVIVVKGTGVRFGVGRDGARLLRPHERHYGRIRAKQPQRHVHNRITFMQWSMLRGDEVGFQWQCS